ncbi:MAG: hypothetical protein AAGM22_19220 [Acidobacteriota bacterium]
MTKRQAPRWRRWCAGWCLMLVAGVAGRLGAQLVEIVASSGRLSQWDMAKYATGGQRLAEALAEFDFLRFVAEIHGLSVWPPTYPLMEVPVLWIGGLDALPLRLFQVGLWVTMVVATAWALRAAGPSGAATGVLAASAVASSPLLAGLATVNMLEVPGLLLLAAALGAYLRAVEAEHGGDDVGKERWWRATWGFSLALFFCKYNYGLFWLAPLVAAEGWSRAGSTRRAAAVALGAGRRFLASGAWRSPFGLFVGMVAALIVGIRATGGVDFEIAGVPVRATSPGGPAQLLYFAVLARLLLPWSKAQAFWRRTRQWPAADRLFVRLFALPVALWFVPPPHLKDFLFFLDNRDDGPAAGSLDWWAFYPRQLFDAYGSVAAGWLVVAGSILAVLGFLRADLRSTDSSSRSAAPGLQALRLLLLGAVFAGLALWSHPYKLPRFAVFLWWWLAALAAWGWIQSVRASFELVIGQRRTRRLAAMPALAASAVALAVGAAGIDVDRVTAEHRLRTVDAEVLRVLEVIAPRDRGGEARTLVLGTWNLLSPHLVEWHARRVGRSDRVESDFFVSRRRPGRLQRRLESGDLDRVAVLAREDDPVFERETAWLAPARAWLQESGAFRPVEESVWAGYRVTVYAPPPPTQ